MKNNDSTFGLFSQTSESANADQSIPDFSSAPLKVQLRWTKRFLSKHSKLAKHIEDNPTHEDALIAFELDETLNMVWRVRQAMGRKDEMLACTQTIALTAKYPDIIESLKLNVLTQAEIAEQSKVSIATVNKINQWLQEGDALEFIHVDTVSKNVKHPDDGKTYDDLRNTPKSSIPAIEDLEAILDAKELKDVAKYRGLVATFIRNSDNTYEQSISRMQAWDKPLGRHTVLRLMKLAKKINTEAPVHVATGEGFDYKKFCSFKTYADYHFDEKFDNLVEEACVQASEQYETGCETLDSGWISWDEGQRRAKKSISRKDVYASLYSDYCEHDCSMTDQEKINRDNQLRSHNDLVAAASLCSKEWDMIVQSNEFKLKSSDASDVDTIISKLEQYIKSKYASEFNHPLECWYFTSRLELWLSDVKRVTKYLHQNSKGAIDSNAVRTGYKQKHFRYLRTHLLETDYAILEESIKAYYAYTYELWLYNNNNSNHPNKENAPTSSPNWITTEAMYNVYREYCSTLPVPYIIDPELCHTMLEHHLRWVRKTAIHRPFSIAWNAWYPTSEFTVDDYIKDEHSITTEVNKFMLASNIPSSTEFRKDPLYATRVEDWRTYLIEHLTAYRNRTVSEREAKLALDIKNTKTTATKKARRAILEDYNENTPVQEKVEKPVKRNKTICHDKETLAFIELLESLDTLEKHDAWSTSVVENENQAIIDRAKSDAEFMEKIRCHDELARQNADDACQTSDKYWD